MGSLREHHLPLGGTNLPLPFFFPSISSVKSNLNLLEYLRVLAALKQSAFLISAYDIYHSSPDQRNKIIGLLRKLKKGNTTVLLDSGNYESFWKNDKSWSPNDFARILATGLSKAAFCFDDQSPRQATKAII